jgi:hypothetical protein
MALQYSAPRARRCPSPLPPRHHSSPLARLRSRLPATAAVRGVAPADGSERRAALRWAALRYGSASTSSRSERPWTRARPRSSARDKHGLERRMLRGASARRRLHVELVECARVLEPRGPEPNRIVLSVRRRVARAGGRCGHCLGSRGSARGLVHEDVRRGLWRRRPSLR